MRRGLVIILIGIVAMGSSCARQYRLDRHTDFKPSPWPYHHGTVGTTGVNLKADFGGQLATVWEASCSGKLGGPLTIYNNALVYPDAKKRVRFYSISDGRYLGKLRSGGSPQTGLSMADSLVFFALPPKHNQLVAMNLINGKTVWKHSLRDACPGTIIVSNGLVVSSTDGEVLNLDLATGEVRWKFLADQRLAAPPAASATTIYQPSDQGRLFALAADDGREVYRIDLDGPIVAPVVIDGDVYAVDVHGWVYAITEQSGQIVWKTRLNGAIWASPALAEDRLIVAHSGGELVALDRLSGSVLWRFDGDEAIKASPIVVGEHVVVGTAAGKVMTLEVTSGRLVAETRVKGAIDFPPISDGSHLFIGTNKGRIICLGSDNGNEETNHQRIDPQGGSK